MIRSIEMVTLFHKSVRPWRFTVANGDLYLTYIYDQLQQIHGYQDVPPHVETETILHNLMLN